MRWMAAVGALICALALADHAAAQSPPNALLTGTMSFSRAFNGTHMCVIGGGPSSFKRNGSVGNARIAFDEVTYASFVTRRNAYVLSGIGHLVFSTATSGQLLFDYNFDYPADIRQATFGGYSQAYNVSAGTLNVSFYVGIRGCNVWVAAVYRL